MTALFANGNQSFESLLESYLSTDRTYKEVALQYEQALLAFQKTQIQNTFNFSFSTGSAQFDIDKDGSRLSFSPSLSLDIPELQNTRLEAKTSLKVPIQDDSSFGVNNASLSLSTDLISSAKKNRELTLKKARESLDEAKRKKDSKSLSLKKEFLQALKSLFSLQTNLLTQEENALTKERDLALLKAQGFEEASAKYRLAYLSWQTALRTYEEAKRSFEKELLDFSKRCAVDRVDINIKIPNEALFSIHDFSKTEFSTIRSSLLSYENNRLLNEAKTPFQLGFNAAYGFSQLEKKDEIEIKNNLSTGISFKKGGLSASFGLQNDLDDLDILGFTFSLGYSFSEQKLSKLSGEEDFLQEKILALAIENAESIYESALIEKDKQKDDLLWQLSKTKEHESLYANLADDMKSWFEKGIISETEYKQAVANHLKAGTELRIAEIDCLVYNIDIALLFY